VTLIGSVSGFFNDQPSQPPLFTANVSGTGTISGVYRLVMNGTDPVYTDNCCAHVSINARQCGAWSIVGPARTLLSTVGFTSTVWPRKRR